MIRLIGAGNMGLAMLSSWLDENLNISVTEPNPSEALLAKHKQKPFVLNPPNTDSLDALEVVVLAVKPDKAKAAIQSNKHLFARAPLLISIAAGVPLDVLKRAAGIKEVVRAMPNTPAQIGKGFIALYADPACSTKQKQRAQKLMTALGEVAFLDDESLMDAITVLSGAGPAYLFYLAEVLAASGEGLGLDSALAHQATLSTLRGAAELLARNPNPRTLREQVTSPKGVTEAAFDVLLKEEPLKKLFGQAFASALARARSLKG